MEKYMGIDVGGTNVKIGIVDREGGMESKIKYSTAQLRESDDFVNGYKFQKTRGHYPGLKI